MGKIKEMRKIRILLNLLLLITVGVFIWQLGLRYITENRALRQVIERLQADSRIADVLVTEVAYNDQEDRLFTTIKFLEYDVSGEPLEPKYFTFAGNIIQFQSLVVRFDDIHIANKDVLRGKSAYLFWKVFMLDGPRTQEYEITEVNRIPLGYKIEGKRSSKFEERLWKKFWEYVLDPAEASRAGIKNAQIEAPGTIFVPGTLYTIKIEHDGGMRIDTAPLPDILRGELIL